MMDRKEGKRTQQWLKPNRKDMKLTATFNRRKNCILKKAHHFSTLCGVDACVIIYGNPSVSDTPDVPDIWPSNPSEVLRIIQRCRRDTIHKKRKPKAAGFEDWSRKNPFHLKLMDAADPSLVSEAVKTMADASLGWEQLQSLRAVLDKENEVAEERLLKHKAMMMEMTRKQEDSGKSNADYPYSHRIPPDYQIASLGTRDSPANQHCYDAHEGSTPLPVVSELTSDLEIDDFDPLIYLNFTDEEISCFTADLLEDQVDTAVDCQGRSPLDVRDPLPAWGDISMEDTHQLQELPSLQRDCSDLHQDWSSLLLNSNAANHCPSVVWGYPVFGAAGQEMMHPNLVDFTDPTIFT